MRTNSIFSLFVALSLALTGGAFAAGYQVKGKVTKVDKSTFTVDTGKQKLQFTKDANTKVKGDIAKDADVTVKYNMQATSVDSKAAAPAAKPAAKPAPAKKAAAAAKASAPAEAPPPPAQKKE